MTTMRLAAVLAALVSSLVPAVALAQKAAIDSVLLRVQQLERTTVQLEQRVIKLEALIRNEPSRGLPASPTSDVRNIQNWRRLRLQMTMDEVRTLLGEPDRVDVLGPFTTWQWDYPTGGRVSFDSESGRLNSWSEPSR